jgi:hypothetical protein
MSEVREVLERTFSTNEQAHAITQAALWLAVHDVDVDSIVGDADYVYVYYTETVQIPQAYFGALPAFPPNRFTLRTAGLGLEPNWEARSAG